MPARSWSWVWEPEYFAGFVEGLGLLLFQRINWARWGPMMHVSSEILSDFPHR